MDGDLRSNTGGRVWARKLRRQSWIMGCNTISSLALFKWPIWRILLLFALCKRSVWCFRTRRFCPTEGAEWSCILNANPEVSCKNANFKNPALIGSRGISSRPCRAYTTKFRRHLIGVPDFKRWPHAKKRKQLASISDILASYRTQLTGGM